MSKRSRKPLYDKNKVAVIVNMFTAIHPDDKKFIKDKLLVTQDHLVFIDTDDIEYIDRVCSDLATLSLVVINNPNGSFEGQYILARLSYLVGLEIMNQQAIYSKTTTRIWIPKYELTNTNDLVISDLVRVV